MRNISKLCYGSMMLAALLGFASKEGNAVEIVQSEGPNQPNACITVMDGLVQINQPLVATSCGYVFSARWQFSGLAIIGARNVIQKGLVLCIEAKPPDYTVILDACNPTSPSPFQSWYYLYGLLSFDFGGSCLASNGYGMALGKPAYPLQLAPCNAYSPSQIWQLN